MLSWCLCARIGGWGRSIRGAKMHVWYVHELRRDVVTANGSAGDESVKKVFGANRLEKHPGSCGVIPPKSDPDCA